MNAKALSEEKRLPLWAKLLLGFGVLCSILLIVGMVYMYNSFFGDIPKVELPIEHNNFIDQEHFKSEYYLAMDFGSTLSLKLDVPKQTTLRVRSNVDNSNESCFYLTYICLRSFTTGTCDIAFKEGSTVEHGVIVGGHQVQDMPVATQPWIQKTLDTVDILRDTVDVIPVVFWVTGARPDTYQMELRVSVNKDHQSCVDAGPVNPQDLVLWRTKRFLIELT